mgnify:CR=1 FL=1
MRIVLLAAGSSIHTVRWANGLSAEGHSVHLVIELTIFEPMDTADKLNLLEFRGALGYFTIVPAVRRILKEVAPDIVNAHYASGYGTTARLVNYRPWVLSVWGSDIYDFPHKSPLHKWMVKRNLRAADRVLSTSHSMAHETRKLVPEVSNIAITPFGVDFQAYKGIEPVSAVQKQKLVIGTVKTMKPHYGIDTLIKAFAQLVLRLQDKNREVPEVELRLVGGGEQTDELLALAAQLDIGDKVHFVSLVPHSQVPQELQKLDIYVALSRRESFGVAVIEAQAAGRPVLVSDAGGLPEVVIDGETGFVVPRENPAAAAKALEKLVLDADLRYRMGEAGQKNVGEMYAWDACIETMLGVYETSISESEPSA